jgi:hypothetical protein
MLTDTERDADLQAALSRIARYHGTFDDIVTVMNDTICTDDQDDDK